jgi:hypothetical protein
MNYSFDIDVAKKYGLDEAIMIYNFQFWIMKNRACGKHEHDGHTWTYNSVKAFSELFPFWNEDKIKRILSSLRDQKVLITGNYNQNAYDRTLWYAFEDESIFLPCTIDSANMPNGKCANARPIPDIKQDSKPNDKPNIRGSVVPATPSPPSLDSSADSTLFGESDNAQEEIKDTVPPRVDKKVFRKPTVDEVRAYCTERGNSIDPEYFVNYNESRGWVVGKSPMKDWRATIRTWEQHERQYAKTNGADAKGCRNAARSDTYNLQVE